ncbi:hypothetical protein [Streptomyces sp. YIM 130001]|uniref:hypothetical protein n=1 Tax=Streptomyces sp. YIM 130001 TaxID=2259644 RepID=UPI0013C50F00|nr:hypothetical protein [Streptomyces sp. YIM 130001]
MNRSGIARRSVLGAALAAVGAAVAGCGRSDGKDGKPEAAKKKRAWRHIHLADAWDGAYVAMAAPARDDVWALGMRGGKDGGTGARLFLDRFDGDTWTSGPLPGDLKADAGFTLHASDSKNVWLAESRPEAATRVHRWDGTKWHLLPETPAAPATTTAPGKGGKLVTAGPEAGWLMLGDTVAHWDGSAWHTPDLDFVPAGLAISAALGSGGDPGVWVAGVRDLDCAEGECYPQPASAVWRKGRWQALDTPEFRFDDPVPPEASAGLDTVVADDAKRGLWAVGRHDFNHGEVDDEPESEEILLQGDGKTWRKRRIPRLRHAIDATTTTPDGRGGLLLDHEHHFTADGDVHKVAWPAEIDGPPDYKVDPRFGQQMEWNVSCLLPGTHTVLAAGAVLISGGDDPDMPSRPMIARFDGAR